MDRPSLVKRKGNPKLTAKEYRWAGEAKSPIDTAIRLKALEQVKKGIAEAYRWAGSALSMVEVAERLKIVKEAHEFLGLPPPEEEYAKTWIKTLKKPPQSSSSQGNPHNPGSPQPTITKKSTASPDKTITVTTYRAVVDQVENLPYGWSWEVIDMDTEPTRKPSTKANTLTIYMMGGLVEKVENLPPNYDYQVIMPSEEVGGSSQGNPNNTITKYKEIYKGKMLPAEAYKWAGQAKTPFEVATRLKALESTKKAGKMSMAEAYKWAGKAKTSFEVATRLKAYNLVWGMK